CYQGHSSFPSRAPCLLLLLLLYSSSDEPQPKSEITLLIEVSLCQDSAMYSWPAHPVAVASPWIWKTSLSPVCSLGLHREGFIRFILCCWRAKRSLPL
ncbi:hypothetical protein CHARACLAT_015805, partial [Characodon lateralis]|nr:hypothetical protein [Characodon lateralis]